MFFILSPLFGIVVGIGLFMTSAGMLYEFIKENITEKFYE
tara:strand:+ start:228 stop:347 length:120 start_codon:yes stop_codon:yes gene_type:complete